jgi:hypothetical protein
MRGTGCSEGASADEGYLGFSSGGELGEEMGKPIGGTCCKSADQKRL